VAAAYPTSPAFSDHAAAILRERYLRRDEQGVLTEDPAGMLARVATAIAAPAAVFGEDRAFWEARFLERLTRFQFLPNSPTLMNAGRPDGQLAACFVLPVDDDLDAIFAALARMARIHQTGGGTGFSFSRLRPRDDHVRSTGGCTSGPVSFIDLFDSTTAVIRAGGRRRGANMAVLRVDHPDIETFIAAKQTPGRLENFNLSVGVTDDFMAAIDAGAAFPLRNPRTGGTVRTIDARALLDTIVTAAWTSGDPGLLFLDEINRHNPTPGLGVIEATNPCGEQPLLPHESCVLASINLAACTTAAAIDWDLLAAVARDAVVFLDNVIEATGHPSKEIAAATQRTRKIGLGVMGLADLLAYLGVPYDSDAALELGGQLAAFITETARATSVELGVRRGSFPAFAASVWPQRGLTHVRNATTTCVAPTGTISLLAGVASGIEPFFALAVARRVLDGAVLTDVLPAVRVALGTLGGEREAALQHVLTHGSIRDLAALPIEVRRRLPIALEIAPERHVRMQAAFQAQVDAAVSKTVNLPANAPVAAVRDVFLLAHRLRLKGITVYRYGTRPGQTLSVVGADARHDCRECAE